LRAFTPQEQRAVKAAASTFRPNPELDTERVILELKVGEALVSMLENKGEPSIVQRTLIRPPSSRIGPLTDAERKNLIETSPVYGKYEDALDPESAHELLAKRAAEKAAEAARQSESDASGWAKVIFGRGPRGGMSVGEQIVRDVSRSIMRSVVTQVKNAILKSVFGSRRR